MKPRSCAGLSRGPSAGVEGEEDLGVPETERYDRGLLLGAGGMGEVHVAFDARLGREVALKRVSAGDPHGAARLAREARVTASLQHPSIVPVYDAGIDDEGQPFFVMRVVEGRSLAQLLAEGDRDGETLIRPLLAVAEAMAYAHARGVVHRDLKPANIVLGEFGEAVVVDWGLAARVGEEGAVAVGTEGYMSPEQGAGEAPSPRDDVYALGVILEALAAGPELAAIAAKARSPAEERYADAAELAAELERYLAGKRVDAHHYSPRELAARFVGAFRVPLAVGAAAVAVLAMVVALFTANLAKERSRAVDAEEEAREALGRSEEAFADLLEAQAALAWDRGAWAEAQILASHSLARRASPSSRGVLSATPTPSLEWGERIPCERPLAARGAAALCRGEGARLRVGGEVRWRTRTRARRAAIGDRFVALVSPSRQLHVLDRETGEVAGRVSDIDPRHPVLALSEDSVLAASSTELVLWRSGAAELVRVAPCAHRNIEALGAGPASVVVACPDGRVVRLDHALGGLAPLLSRGPDAPRVSALAIHGDTLALGDLEGRVAILRGGRPAGRVEGDDGAIRRLALHDGLLLSRGERGPVRVGRAADGALLFPLPLGVVDVFTGVDGELVAAEERSLRSLRVVDAGGPMVRHFPEGLAGAARDERSGTIAVARGDGVVSLLSGDLRSLGDHTLCEGCVVKRVDYGPTGQLAAALAAPGGLRRFEPGSWTPMPAFREDRALRRLTFAGSTLATVGYGPDLVLWSPAGGATRVATPVTLDLDGLGAVVTLLGADGRVRRCEGAACEAIGRVPGGVAVATTDDGAVVATEDTLVRLARGDAPRRLARLVGVPLDLARAGDGALMLGLRDGTVEVRSAAGALLATLRAHRQRSAHVEASADGALSTSWDGTIRLWNPHWRGAPPAPELAEARWGRDLEEVVTTLAR